MSLLFRFIHGPVCLAGGGFSLVFLFLAACASPNPKPFEEFSKATASVGPATSKALKESTAQSRDGLIDSVQDLQGFNALKLYFRSEPGAYTWGNQPDASWKDVLPPNADLALKESSPSPEFPPLPGPHSAQWINYYYKPQRMAGEIDAFNQTLAQYGSLLSNLAEKKFISEDDFKKMATSLNARASEIGRRVGLSAPRETALFSVSAMALFEQYLKSKQKSVLRHALAENSAQIRQFSKLGQELTFLLSVPVQRSYGQSFDALQRLFEAARTGGGRRKQVQGAVALNDSMIDRWELFAQMDRIYQGLPAAHEDLAKAVEGKGGFTALQEMGESALRLQKIYESLKESNEKAAKAEAKKEAE